MEINGQQLFKKCFLTLLLILSFMLVIGNIVKPIDGSSSNYNVAQAADNKTLVFGDSITKGAESNIKSKIKGAKVDGVVGRSYVSGKSDLQSYSKEYNKSGNKVVVGLGTNGGLTKGNINEIKKMFNKADLTFVDTYVSKNAPGYVQDQTKSTNAALKSSGVDVINWSSSAKKYLGADGVHPNANGSKEFANLIAEGIKGSSSKESKDDDEKESKDDEGDGPGRSYASYVFDKTDDNQSMLYFKSDAPAGTASVETTVNKAIHDSNGNLLQKGLKGFKALFEDDKSKYNKGGGEGLKYATFLKTLHDWNLYHTYTNQLEVGAGIVTKIFIGIYGAFLIGLVWLAKALDALIIAFAKLMDSLNIFKYFAPGGKLPKGPLQGLQPLLDLFQGMGQLALIALAIGLAFLMVFTIIGVGKARNRGGYFIKGFALKMLQAFAIVGLPLMLAGFLTSFSQAVINGGKDGFVTSNVDKIPKNYIVDTSGWVKGSIKNVDQSKGINGGYVLKKGSADWPTSGAKSVTKNIPDDKFVKAINDISGDNKSGDQLLNEWRTADTFTPGDLDTMYKVSKEDKENFWNKDEKRLFQFKLAPESEKVKAFTGKDGMVSLDLNEVSIRTASLVGNTAFGVFLNGAMMGVQITCIVFVSIALLTAVMMGVFKSVMLLATNVVKAQLGSAQAFLGVLSTCIMLLVTVFTAFIIIGLYANLSQSLTSSITHSINDSLAKNTPGVIKQVIQALVTVFVYVLTVFLAFKMRAAIVQGTQQFLTRMMEHAGIDVTGRHTGHQPAGVNALSEMAGANDDGQGMVSGTASSLRAGMAGSGKSALESMQDNDYSLGAAGTAMKDGLGAMVGKAGEKANERAQREGEDDKTLTGKISGKLAEGLNAINDKIAEGNEGAILDAQENEASNVEDAMSDADKARDNLDKLKQQRDEAEANGASAEELEAMDADIEDAEKELARLENDEAQSAENLAKVGGGDELADESAEATLQDEQDAQHELAQAKRDLQNLEADREDLIADNASQEEIDSIDQQIANAKARVSDAEDKLSMVQNRGDGVIDRNNLDNSENDIIAAQQGLRNAEKSYQSALDTGNLDGNDVSKMQNTAKGFAADLDKMEQTGSQKLAGEQEKLAAMERVNSHGGSFTQQDTSNVASSVKNATSEVANASSKLKQLESSGGSKADIRTAKQNLTNAKANLSGAESVQQAVQSGKVTSQAISSQQQRVSQLETKANQAQQRLTKLKEQQANGVSISKGSIQEAQKQVQQTQSQLSGARSIMNGLNAQRLTGGQVSKEGLMQQRSVVKNQKATVDKIKQASQDMNNVMGSKTLNKKAMSSFINASNLVRTNAATNTQQAQANYDQQNKELGKLRKLYSKPGSNISMAQITRKENAVKESAGQLKQAQLKEKAVQQDISGIKTTGSKMSQNIQNAATHVQSSKRNLSQRQARYKQLGRVGGINKSTISRIQQGIKEDKANLQANAVHNRDSYAAKHFRDRKRGIYNKAMYRKQNQNSLKQGRNRNSLNSRNGA